MAVGIMTEIDASTGGTESERPEERVLRNALLAVRGGDRDAFRSVMVESERRIASLAWRILGDPEEVKDAVQETFLRVYRFIDRYDPKRDVFPWLFRITVNVCRDLERKRRRRMERTTELGDAPIAGSSPGPAELAEQNEEVALLAAALDALPAKERLAIVLRDVEGFPTDEVAQILGNRPATVRGQVRNARARIRSFISEKQKGARS